MGDLNRRESERERERERERANERGGRFDLGSVESNLRTDGGEVDTTMARRPGESRFLKFCCR